MKTCYMHASTRSILDLCEHHHYGDGWLITRINVPRVHRGQGVARRLLQKVLDEADAEGQTLFLWICPSDGLSFTALEEWYMRHGFEYWKGIYRRKAKPEGRKKDG